MGVRDDASIAPFPDHTPFVYPSIMFEDGTLEVSTAKVAGSVSSGAAGLKLGRRESASATRLRRPRLYLTEKLYSAMNDSHLANRCERCGLFTAV